MLALALRLCLTRHGIFQGGRDDDIANLNGLHLDAPVLYLLFQSDLESVPELHPGLDEFGQVVFPDRVAQRRLRKQDDGLVVVLNFELGVSHDPEGDGVDVYRDGITC